MEVKEEIFTKRVLMTSFIVMLSLITAYFTFASVYWISRPFIAIIFSLSSTYTFFMSVYYINKYEITRFSVISLVFSVIGIILFFLLAIEMRFY